MEFPERDRVLGTLDTFDVSSDGFAEGWEAIPSVIEMNTPAWVADVGPPGYWHTAPDEVKLAFQHGNLRAVRELR
jgi:hypothetical protein